jgi:hypothetical protein
MKLVIINDPSQLKRRHHGDTCESLCESLFESLLVPSDGNPCSVDIIRRMIGPRKKHRLFLAEKMIF